MEKKNNGFLSSIGRHGTRVVSFIKGGWVQACAVLGFLLIWEVVAKFIVRNTLIFPAFSDVILAFGDRGTLLAVDFLVSILHLLMGLGAAIIIGLPMGAIMGWFTVGRKIFGPIVEILRPIPPLAWIPIAIIWFALTDISAGFIIFVGCFFPILTNTYAGFRGTPTTLIESGRVLGCRGHLSLMRNIALPNALPMIATGVRIAIGVGWMSVVAAEMFGLDNFGFGNAGLGSQLWVMYHLHVMDAVFMYMILLGLVGLVMNTTLGVVEARVLDWHFKITGL